MKNNQSFTLQAFWVGIGSFSSFSLAIVSAVILSRYFTKVDYGSYKQIIYIYESLLLIFSAGLPRVFGYFLPRYGIEEGKDIVKRITLYLFGMGILFSIFLFICSGLLAEILNNPSLETSIKIFSPVPSLLLPTLGIEGIFSSYKRSQFIAIYNTVSRCIMLLLIVSPVVCYEPNLHYILIGWNIASLLSLIFAIYLIRRFFISVSSIKASLSSQEIFKYSIPLVYASISGVFINAADQFYISRFFGSEVFAEFSNGFQQIPFVTMITGAASIVLMPAYSKLQYDKSSVGDIVVLWNSALKKSAIMIYPIVLFCIFYAKDIIVLLYSTNYEASSKYFQLAMSLNFFNIIVFAPLILAYGKTRLYSRVHFISGVILWSGGLIIIKLFNNPFIYVIFSVLNKILLIIYFFYVSSLLLNCKFVEMFPLKFIFKLIMHGLICSLITYIVTVQFSINNFSIIFFSAFIYFLILIGTSQFVNIDYFSVVRNFIYKAK